MTLEERKKELERLLERGSPASLPFHKLVWYRLSRILGMREKK